MYLLVQFLTFYFTRFACVLISFVATRYQSALPSIPYLHQVYSLRPTLIYSVVFILLVGSLVLF